MGQDVTTGEAVVGPEGCLVVDSDVWLCWEDCELPTVERGGLTNGLWGFGEWGSLRGVTHFVGGPVLGDGDEEGQWPGLSPVGDDTWDEEVSLSPRPRT